MTTPQKPQKIQVIETEDGAFIGRLREYNSLNGYLFDGAKPKPTFHKDWFHVAQVPTLMQRTVSHPDTNHRYELKAEFLETEGFSGKTLGKMKPSIPINECQSQAGMYDEWIWNEEYKHLASLYELKSDAVEDTLEDVEFDAEVILKIDNIKEYSGMSFPVRRTQWKQDGYINITDSDAHHQAIDCIVFPSLMRHARPARFTSEQVYKIVREHIIRNIDLEVCEITSDYDFCFTVKKRISPHGTFTKAKAKNPNLRTPTRSKCELSTVFEMTHEGENYKGYTAIPAIAGKNNADLKRKINLYLKTLIKELNTPTEICHHCNGTGINGEVISSKQPSKDL